MMRVLMRADGSTERFERPLSINTISALIDADVCDTVTLRHLGEPLHVMVIDDRGWETEKVIKDREIHLVPIKPRKPINTRATSLYWENCAPGTEHQIAGDVFICPDSDFAGPMWPK